MSRVRGIRGATIADSNTREAILQATRDLLGMLVDANDLCVEDIAAAFFTTTEDLNAEFPAQAARQMGWVDVALLDGQEIKVPDAMAQCIRVMLLVNSDKAPQELNSVYLKGTVNLRKRGTAG